MATTHDPRSAEGEARARRKSGPGPKRLRWNTGQYHRMAELGFFRNRRVELIEGDIIVMSPINPSHSVGVDLAGEALRAAFGPNHRVRIQQPIDLGRHNQPEPDLAVVTGQARDFATHPRLAPLVVEVSDSSVKRDRTVKAHVYARAAIADYWILNLVDRQLEVHRKPGPDPNRRGRFRYADVTILSATETVAPLAAPNSLIVVADLLP